MLNRRNNHAMTTYDPFREMDNFERHFFEDPFGVFFSDDSQSAFKTDITDEGDAYRLEADLPGFDKKDIHVDINGDRMTVSAQRHSDYEEKDKKGKYIRSERSYGTYSRSFDVSGVDTEGIKGGYKDGVLTLTLPKKADNTPTSHRIELE